MTSINQQINQMQSWTSQQEALKSKTEGSSNELNQDMFLKLMLEQLKYQDPLNPMSNQDFLAQQAQFTQLEQLQKLNENITSNNSLTQGMDLIGKEVTLIDPDDPKNTITGVVEEAVFYQNGCAVKIDGKEYPAGLIISAKTPSEPVVPPSDDTGNTDGTDNNTDGNENDSAASAASLSKIAGAVSYIAGKLNNYLK